jgi:hypothetical protein
VQRFAQCTKESDVYSFDMVLLEYTGWYCHDEGVGDASKWRRKLRGYGVKD